ncbi:rhodanese-related sulfurtransferase [Globomyces pollinis-pini]|nr:rhodanese-related sulfurtransferase [Globomyces pollinis-pini]
MLSHIQRRLMHSIKTPSLVSTEWLSLNKSAIILDCSWHLGKPTLGAEEFKQIHIPNARFLDIDKVSDSLSSLPHMLPSASDFAKHMRNLGISNQSHVVVYDSIGLFASPRVWWMFKVFGHQNVSVLDGGLKKWVAEGREVESKITSFEPSEYVVPQTDKELVINYPELLQKVSDFVHASNFTLVDARSNGRFSGRDPEPREGLSSGHVPSAINIPFGDLINKESGTLKSPDDIKQILVNANLRLDKPVITMCGSGVTAAILYLALDQLGKTDVRLYDGSWTEWASNSKSPISKY